MDEFSVFERPAVALDAAIEHENSPEGCGDGTRLNVDGGNLIASTTDVGSFREVIIVNVVRQNDI